MKFSHSILRWSLGYVALMLALAWVAHVVFHLSLTPQDNGRRGQITSRGWR